MQETPFICLSIWYCNVKESQLIDSSVRWKSSSNFRKSLVIQRRSSEQSLEPVLISGELRKQTLVMLPYRRNSKRSTCISFHSSGNMATRDVIALDNEDCDVDQLNRHLDGLISIRERHRKILTDSKSNWLTDDIDY